MTGIQTHRGGTYQDKDPNIVPHEGIYVGVNDPVTNRLDESMDIDAGSSAADMIPLDEDVPSAGSADNVEQLDELDLPSSGESRIAPALQPPPPLKDQQAPSDTQGSRGKQPASKKHIVGEKKKQGNIESWKAKFQELDHACLPPGIPIWIDALSKVDMSRLNYEEIESRVRQVGYVFPDFTTFLNSTNSDIFFINWLVTRSAHISAMAAKTYEARPSANQDWRTFLGRALKFAPMAVEGLTPEMVANILSKEDMEVSYGPPTKGRVNADGSIAPAARRKRIPNNERWQRILELFPEDVIPPWTPEKLYYNDHVVQTTDYSSIRATLSTTVSAEIIWELCELNFRFELIALDRTIRPDLWVPENTAIREDEVQQIFFGDGILVDGIPMRNSGLAATLWRERIPFVTALRNVMKDWYAHDPHSQRRHLWSRFIPNNFCPTGEQELEKLESELARLYCQTFFEKFARAPVCPRRIPVRQGTCGCEGTPDCQH